MRRTRGDQREQCGGGEVLARRSARLRGDFEGAERAYREAHERGRDPQPGFALLRLTQGRADEAAAAIGSSLETCSSQL